MRVIRASEAGYPAFYRVIWGTHVAELSDLTNTERAHCLNVVVAVERAMRELLDPIKINLAALGNMVPHLHWHVVARFKWDSHFPSPIWATAVREAEAEHLAWVEGQLPALDAQIALSLNGLSPCVD